ncbi:MAG: domain containing protein [Acidobacteriales bacterium]|nr:domain containing protein [Terriglobales bacterium]
MSFQDWFQANRTVTGGNGLPVDADSGVAMDLPAPLGDFTATKRLIPISLFAIVIGVVSSYLALWLLRLIDLATNLFFFQRFSFQPASPADHHLGPWVILVPVIGGLIIGLMARYGSDRIRGHGIPEALESILLRGSKIQAKVALLKPVSAAISIGSGGPFGAEGPIIMTGGAVGSLLAQFFHLTDTERKTLLVAGAAAGMSATFAAPIASVLLAVELLLFELKPRSLVPVALATATAAAARRYLLGMGPLFTMKPHVNAYGFETLVACAFMGLVAGMLAFALTKSVYLAEDAYEHLPFHWMWWPAIGGLVIGIGGWLFPPVMGVGYSVIGEFLQGDAPLKVILGILVVKSLIWSFSLGSGTSGGVLAPLMMIGGALGAAGAHFFPALFTPQGLGFWPLISMAAVLGGTMRAPLTAVIFSIELTRDINLMLPLLIAAVIAHAFTVLFLRRSILTEKLSRRGYHLSREYSIDPLEITFVREVMRTSIVALPAELALADLKESVAPNHARSGQWLYPVVGSDKQLLNVVTRHEIEKIMAQTTADGLRLRDVVPAKDNLVVAYPGEPLRIVVNRMARSGFTRFPVIDRRSDGRKGEQDRGHGTAVPKLVGVVAITDLLKARVMNLQAEHERERVLPIRVFLPARFRKAQTSD